MCKFCLQVDCPPQCPNYEAPAYLHTCDFCGFGIYQGEEYVKNIDGDYIHYDCIDNMPEFIRWCKCEKGIMYE